MVTLGGDSSDCLPLAPPTSHLPPPIGHAPPPKKSGIDVARKALILHRLTGGVAELTDVVIEGLYPRAMDSLSVDAFMNRPEGLSSLDEQMASWVDKCHQAGTVLRFGASISVVDDACRVGPLEVRENYTATVLPCHKSSVHRVF